jgi:hypothetical protein
MINGMMVSTETHSNRQVAEDFLRWRANKNARTEKTKRAFAGKKFISAEETSAISKAVNAKKPRSLGRPKSAIRTQAKMLFGEGKTAAEVAQAMDISYANAHYYKRAFKKEGV